MEYKVVIPGKPYGFLAGAKFWSKKTAPMRFYSQHIRRVAEDAGIPLPLNASKNKPLHIETVAYYPSGVHCDPENTHKLVKDSLFYKAKGGDKYTGGSYSPPLYDKENPRVEIFIRLA